ncbi:MAG: phosphotransferase [Chlamydiales bacterium]|nr:phosphotransferase [Chlamydiales bacterium]
MTRLWEAEHIVEAPRALAMIQEQFPNLGAQNIKLIGVGWDNTAFLVDDTFVFRFPRRQIAVPLLRHEACMLPKLAESLSIPIPVPKWLGMPTDDYPWPFSGYELLKGRTACHVDLSDADRIKLAPSLATFLSTLHSVPINQAEYCNLPGDMLGRLNVARILPIIQQNLQEIVQLRLMDTTMPFQHMLEEAKALRPPHDSKIVHGDFYIRHLLLDDAHHLAGVIDWGDIHIGDPALDLSIIHSFLPPKGQELFRATYGEISAETWLLARLRAIHQSANLAVFSHHTGDKPLVRESMRALLQIASFQ